MRLLPTSPDGLPTQMREYLDFSCIPKYAVLSHTWGADEVSLQELGSLCMSTKGGSDKIRRTCSLAHSRDGLQHAWIDTCCIDKTSSAELTEAINSMYTWYAGADVCYAYLSDLPPGTFSDLDTALPACKWFTRGWTLQELIAPRNVVFFDRDWNERGNKHDLSSLLCRITGIPAELLHHRSSLNKYSVARRMSWAAMRKTTRAEDLAYCLQGLFHVHLSLIYGEGMKKAFYRLQEAIVLSTADLSIFVWTENRPQHKHPAQPNQMLLAPILAEEPIQFADCGNVAVALEDSTYRELTVTTRGIQVEASLRSDMTRQDDDDAYKCIWDPYCTDESNGGAAIGIALRKVAGGRYVRYKPHIRISIPSDFRPRLWSDKGRMLVEQLTLATTIPTPDQFPFPGPNAVVGNRHCAFQVRWLDTTPAPFSLHQFRPVPRSHWDVHDQVFISSARFSKGWCGFFAHGMIRLAGNAFIPLHIFVSCHFWNVGRPRVVVASLDELESSTAVLLEMQLDRIRFESNRQAESLILSVFDGKIPSMLSTDECAVLTGEAVVGTVVVVEGGGGGSEATRSSSSRLFFPGQQILHSNKSWNGGNTGWEKVKVKVTAEVVEQYCKEICELPMWRVDVGCRILEEGDTQTG